MSPKHAAALSKRQTIMAYLLVIASVGAIGIYQGLATNAASGIVDRVSNEVLSDFPGTLAAQYGSYQAATALFSEGMPDSLPDTNIFEIWAVENGGILAWRSVLCLTLTGNSPEPIWIDDIIVDVVSLNDNPPSGLYLEPRGGGDIFDRLISYNFEESISERDLTSDTGGGQWSFPLWVSDTESETPCLLFETWTQDVEFAVLVDFRYSGDQRRVRVLNNGEPFRLVGPANADQTLRLFFGDPVTYEILDQSPQRP